MIYTVFCPCHPEPVTVETNAGSSPVKVGDEMQCGDCTCIHRVQDVEAGESAGRVRLVRMAMEDARAAYAAIGRTLIVVTCPTCSAECCGLADEGRDVTKPSFLFCQQCHLPMVIEGDTAREPNEDEQAMLVRLAIARMVERTAPAPSTADRLDRLFPETPFGNDPFGKGGLR